MNKFFLKIATMGICLSGSAHAMDAEASRIAADKARKLELFAAIQDTEEQIKAGARAVEQQKQNLANQQRRREEELTQMPIAATARAVAAIARNAEVLRRAKQERAQALAEHERIMRPLQAQNEETAAQAADIARRQEQAAQLHNARRAAREPLPPLEKVEIQRQQYAPKARTESRDNTSSLTIGNAGIAACIIGGIYGTYKYGSIMATKIVKLVNKLAGNTSDTKKNKEEKALYNLND